jgi:hypothetical protein
MKPDIASPDPAADAIAAFEPVSMDLPMPMLDVMEIPGYHLHWMADRPGRIQQAMRAGYEFVKPEEVQVNPSRIIGGASDGNSDMGTKVGILTNAGDERNGGVCQQYLMKIRLEWYRKNKSVLDARNNLVLEAINKGAIGSDKTRESQEDFRARYSRGGTVPSFQVRR